jgi:hypothetical protein
MIQTYGGTRCCIVERQRRKASTGSLNGFGRALFSLSPFSLLFRRQPHLDLLAREPESTDYKKRKKKKERTTKKIEKHIYIYRYYDLLMVIRNKHDS